MHHHRHDGGMSTFPTQARVVVIGAMLHFAFAEDLLEVREAVLPDDGTAHR